MNLYEKMQEKLDKNPFLSLTEVIAAVYADEIVYHRIDPGSKLIVKTAAEECHASRTPVKAAFDKLVTDGLLELNNKTYIVKAFDEQDYLNYYLLRIELEAKAIRATAKRITPKELRQLDVYRRNLNRALQEQRIDDITNCEILFHRYVVRCSHNPYFISAFEELTPQIRRYMIYDLTETERFTLYMRHHDILFSAIQVGAPEVCEAAVRAHLEQYALNYENIYMETQADYRKLRGRQK